VANRRKHRQGADEWIADFRSNLMWLINPDDRKSAERIRIAALDTGIDGEHPDIRRMWRVPDGEASEGWLREHYADFLPCQRQKDKPELGLPKDLSGHGTSTSGILLQLAPNADLYVGRISELGQDVGSVIGPRLANVGFTDFLYRGMFSFA
jgi:hypothetical protein